jgi:hypothetical protein
LLAIAIFGLRVPLPRIPEGDVLASGRTIARAAWYWSDLAERIESGLRQWPIASLSLVAVAILLGATMLVAR